MTKKVKEMLTNIVKKMPDSKMLFAIITAIILAVILYLVILLLPLR